MGELSATSKYLSLSSLGSDYKIPIDSILYIESDRRKLTIHTAQEDYSCYEKLDIMENTLNAATFVRCHQSYLVAIDRIISYIDHCVTLRNTDIQIPVSRQHQKKVRDLLQNQPTAGALICISGIYKGSIIRIKPEQRILIGRDGKTVDIVINVPMISRLHCEITYHKENREYEITDYSSNGTFINGNTRLIPNQSYIVKAETEVSFGDALTVYKLV